MKLLTTNFVQCTVRACASSSECFPLHFEQPSEGEVTSTTAGGAERLPLLLTREEQDYSPVFMHGILPRIDWPALLSVYSETVAAVSPGQALPETKPVIENIEDPEADRVLRILHSILLETNIVQGEMRCRSCGHVYFIRDSVPNFLLPGHLVE
ncbi:uncharacterized protein V1518DRAFT_421986 [Limtongia smithiae]|uniref:uncharacterized protein n=1 Tax=Limtongia smithiae TaxID=1125753 RepID=UPI0034CDA914